MSNFSFFFEKEQEERDNIASASACNVSFFSLCFFCRAQKILHVEKNLYFGMEFIFGLCTICTLRTLLIKRSVHQLLLIVCLSVYLPICVATTSKKNVKIQTPSVFFFLLERPFCSSVYLYICYLTNIIAA
jgi:hypothetical protein